MTLVHIMGFALLSLIVGWVLPTRWRLRFLWIASLLAVFILQPISPIRSLDFWLPLASIGLTLLVWAITIPKSDARSRGDLATFALTAGIILLVSLPRYLGDLCCLTASRPPAILPVLLAALLALSPALLVYHRKTSSRALPWLAILLILALFVVLKYPPLGLGAGAALRRLSGQDTSLAGSLDLAWLGFSYLAFRLLHVLRDYQSGKLPAFSAAEFTTYALFYPSLTAGPIDRSQRFIQKDLRNETPVSSAEQVQGIKRILIGAFKKFVIADSLALVALNTANALQVDSSLWMWLLLYAYALRIYFDFSGYIDVALGIALLVGIHLPENFAGPYLKTNLTAFWNSWNITLAQWLRAYVFNPLTRSMRTSGRAYPVWLVILTGQAVTMLLLGLWHGITWNYAIWGLWHAAGLFAHNRWSDWVHRRGFAQPASPGARLGLTLGGWFITFQFVTLGWVWFALPDVESALRVFRRLFGG
jgi:D-alanyl-lipoteichoic acid acyltransferase DltB (MBOAT superfamily)